MSFFFLSSSSGDLLERRFVWKRKTTRIPIIDISGSSISSSSIQEVRLEGRSSEVFGGEKDAGGGFAGHS